MGELGDAIINFLEVTTERSPEWKSTAKDDRNQVTNSLGKHQNTNQGCLEPQVEKMEFLAVGGG